jgi:hypothetical protein
MSGGRDIVVSPNASPEEAAAIAAAITRLLTVTEPAVEDQEQHVSGWLAAARGEALRGDLPPHWGGSSGWA